MSGFTGTGLLAKLFLRRDRIRIAVWILAIWVLVVPSIATFPDLYKTQEAIDVRNELLSANPMGIALTGPGYGLDRATPDNLAPMAVNEMLGTTIIALALMAIFMTVRHTRGEEQEGRLELMRAGIVGEYAPVTAAFTVVTGMSVVLGVMLALGFMSLGYAAAGSFAFGLSMAVVGIAFAAVAALTAQVTEHSRAATGLALVVFAVLFAIRTIGDIEGGAWAWISPISWANAVRPFADERWWTLLLPLLFAAVTLAAAFALLARRDVGAGLVPTRKGRPRATAFLTRPLGLALRLQRGSAIAWGVGLAVFAAMIGSLAVQAQSMFEALSDVYEAFFGTLDGASVVETFLSGYLVFIAMTAIGQALQSAVLVRGEESKGRVEPMLAGSLSRFRWAGSYMLATFLTSVLILAFSGLALAVTYSASTGEPADFGKAFWAMVNYAPAVLLFAGLAFALFGLAPRLMSIAWAAFAWIVTIGIVGPLLNLPDWAMDLTPFAHTPQLPAQDFDAVPLLVMGAITLALTLAGLLAFRRRDIDLG